MEKARVALLKTQTVPRLELQAAVLAATTANLLKSGISMDVNHYYWTDSTIVLSYVQNESRCFHTYVANRIQKINNLTDNCTWQHVESHLNPADIGSRRMDPTNLMKSPWFRGPDFLHSQEIYKSPVSINNTLTADDPEVRKDATALTTVTSVEANILSHLSKISDWNKLVNAISLLLDVMKRKTKQAPISSLQIRTTTEQRIIKLLQTEHYREILHNKQEKNQLQSLSPFIDEDGLLRVSGRLSNSTTLNYGVHHPIILPSHAHVTNLIIQHIHAPTHQGRITMNALRSNGYWIVGCNSAVSTVIRKCVFCKRHRTTEPFQRMADLPRPWVEPAPPYLFSGVDCFGPFYATDRRKESKRYGLVVTCLASRAVHIELLLDLSTDSFINGIRNVLAIRGHIQQIRCDHGTNFIGAHNELSREFSRVSIPRVKDFLMKTKTEFLLNPPHSSNFGGVWERVIGPARKILNVLAKSGRLTTNSLRTVLYEVMAIMNSRPLTAIRPDLEPLTPNHLLTGKTSVITQPGKFEANDLYAQKQQKRVQSLGEDFWRRWQVEYFNILQSRQKLTKPQRNLNIGDVVVIKELDKPRNLWRLGLVTAVTSGTDNLVRKIKVRLADSTELERPSSGVILLVTNDNATSA